MAWDTFVSTSGHFWGGGTLSFPRTPVSGGTDATHLSCRSTVFGVGEVGVDSITHLRFVLHVSRTSMQYDAASSASSTTARTDAVNASPVVVAKAELLRPPRMSLMEGDLSSNPALRSRMDSLLKEVRCKLIHGPSCAPFSGVSANVHRKIFWCSLHVACVVRDRLGSSLRRTCQHPNPALRMLCSWKSSSLPTAVRQLKFRI